MAISKFVWRHVSRRTGENYPILIVLFNMSCLPCLAYNVVLAVSCLPCPVYPVLLTLPYVPCPACHILLTLSGLSSPAYRVLFTLFRLPCSAYLVLLTVPLFTISPPTDEITLDLWQKELRRGTIPRGHHQIPRHIFSKPSQCGKERKQIGWLITASQRGSVRER